MRGVNPMNFVNAYPIKSAFNAPNQCKKCPTCENKAFSQALEIVKHIRLTCEPSALPMYLVGVVARFKFLMTIDMHAFYVGNVVDILAASNCLTDHVKIWANPFANEYCESCLTLGGDRNEPASKVDYTKLKPLTTTPDNICADVTCTKTPDSTTIKTPTPIDITSKSTVPFPFTDNDLACDVLVGFAKIFVEATKTQDGVKRIVDMLDKMTKQTDTPIQEKK